MIVVIGVFGSSPICFAKVELVLLEVVVLFYGVGCLLFQHLNQGRDNEGKNCFFFTNYLY